MISWRRILWGIRLNRMRYEVIELLPPVRSYRVLDIGCGKGKGTVFFAKCGYGVTAFDLFEPGLDKSRRLAEHNRVAFRLFKSGEFHFIRRKCGRTFVTVWKPYRPNGFCAINVFVHKPFVDDSIDRDKIRHPWRSGTLFGCYHNWLFHECREKIFDGNSGVPHRYCMPPDCPVAGGKEGADEADLWPESPGNL